MSSPWCYFALYKKFTIKKIAYFVKISHNIAFHGSGLNDSIFAAFSEVLTADGVCRHGRELKFTNVV
jgi:hypothetical protein